jgi:putative ABC transport system permease protein
MTTPFPLGPAIKQNFQEVELMVRIYNMATQVKTPAEQFAEQVTIVGEDFLNLFHFELIEGRREAVLSQQSSLLLTEETAKRFFGKENPLGKTLSLFLNERFESFTVTGVLKDPPENSSVRFRMVISDLNNPTRTGHPFESGALSPSFAGECHIYPSP